MLRRSIYVALVLTAALLTAACGSQPKRPSQDVVLTMDAFALIERLKSAYSARDMAALEQLSSEAAYASIKAGMKDFRSVTLELTNRWVDIREDGSIEVRLSWDGAWKLSGDDTEVKQGGKAVMVMSGRVLKLIDIKGSSPFAGP